MPFLHAPNRYYLGIFPGFLHMLHHPEQHFPPHVKTLLMSQSDFQLPDPGTRDLPQIGSDREYKYDFTYAATWPLATEQHVFFLSVFFFLSFFFFFFPCLSFFLSIFCWLSADA